MQDSTTCPTGGSRCAPTSPRWRRKQRPLWLKRSASTATGSRARSAAYNAACRSEDGFKPLALDGLATEGLTPRKSNWARPVDRPPFRAWPIIAANCFTFGGLKINPRAQVLNTDGETIPGLYAAGETAGLYYRTYTGLHLGDAGRGLRPDRRSRRGGAQEPPVAGGVAVSQIALPAVFMRGGTSKGLFFHRRDLPAERARWDALFLAALGSPDPHGRQLDGMGGGISSLSKVVVVSPSTRPGVDIDYLFGQVAVDRALVDYRSNCGNLTAAVGPFAVDEGLVDVADGETALTLHNCNLDQRIEACFEVAGGRAVVEGDTVLDGVAGHGAPIHLSFLEPGGAVTGRLLPTGRPRDVLDVPGVGEIEATLIDASTALVVVRADALGLSGVELPDAIEADPALTDRLEAIRRAGAAAMGIAPETESVPKVGFVAPPADAATLSGVEVAAEAVDLSARVISMGRPHRALPLTAALALAAAARIPGTVADEVARPGAGSDSPVRIGHPSGVAEIAVDLAAANPPHVTRVTVTRTARRLMEGRVLIPAHHLASASDTD